MTDLTNHHGGWTGMWRTWLRPHELHDESPITLEVSATDDGSRIDYRGSIGDDPVTGHMVVAADGTRIAWLDTWHTEGVEQELTGTPPSYQYGPADEPWTWAIRIEPDTDELVIIHTNQPPGYDPVVAVEMRSERAD